MYRNAKKEKAGKPIPGTNKVAVQGDPTQLRKIRCPACQQVAVASQDANGVFVATCTCGRSFRSTPL